MPAAGRAPARRDGWLNIGLYGSQPDLADDAPRTDEGVGIEWRRDFLYPLTQFGESRRGFCDAIMAYWRLVTPRLARTVRDAGGELYAWTVDDPAAIAKLESMGVTGIITNDPRLFAAATAA